MDASVPLGELAKDLLHVLFPRISLEARPAIIWAGAFVGPVMIRGIIDASATRNP